MVRGSLSENFARKRAESIARKTTVQEIDMREKSKLKCDTSELKVRISA